MKSQCYLIEYTKQDCLSVNGRPPTNVCVFYSYTRMTRFCSCDLDLDPTTLVHEFHLAILKTYLHTKNQFCMSRLLRLEHRQTDTHTHTDATERITTAAMVGDNSTAWHSPVEPLYYLCRSGWLADSNCPDSLRNLSGRNSHGSVHVDSSNPGENCVNQYRWPRYTGESGSVHVNSSNPGENCVNQYRWPRYTGESGSVHVDSSNPGENCVNQYRWPRYTRESGSVHVNSSNPGEYCVNQYRWPRYTRESGSVHMNSSNPCENCVNQYRWPRYTGESGLVHVNSSNPGENCVNHYRWPRYTRRSGSVHVESSWWIFHRFISTCPVRLNYIILRNRKPAINKLWCYI